MSRTREALVIAGAVAGVLAIAGSVSLVGAPDREAPSRPPSTSAAAAPAAADPGSPPGLTELTRGEARVDPAAARSEVELAPARERTITGAVEAFVADAVWVLGSPAAETAPAEAARVVSPVLNPADREMLAAMPRAGGVALDARAGAYRVLGHAGKRARPDAVMVEVSAPLTSGTSTRWLVAGGVVSWAEGQWQLQSLRPRDAGGPAAAAGRSSSPDGTPGVDDATALPGLGWVQFGNADLG